MIGKRSTLTPGSVVDYEWAIDKHIKPGLGAVRLRDLERKDIRAFFESRTTLNGGKGKVYGRVALSGASGIIVRR
jgi:hypothetical protein